VEVLILLIFVSLVLATSAVLFFAWGLRERVYDHAERLALLPLEEDGAKDRSRVSSSGDTGNERERAPTAVGGETCAEESGSRDA
jgi:cbb3-type cytochrome oxidase maturation protein